MKKITIAMAALAALTLSACQKEDGGKTDNGKANGKAGLSLSFELPTRAVSRAFPNTVAGTESESAIGKVEVFIFEPSGILTATGGYSRFDDIAADFTASGSKYTLNADKVIETTAGQKHIYIAVNTPANESFGNWSGNEEELLAVTAQLSAMTVTNNFTMFSKLLTPSLVQDADTVTEGIQPNAISAPVDRVVAKLVASSQSDNNDLKYSYSWSQEASGLTLDYTLVDYQLFQDATQSFVAPNFWSTLLLKTFPGIAPTPALGDTNSPFTAFATEVAEAPKAILTTHPTTEAALRDETQFFYLAENYPVDQYMQPYARENNATYIYISGNVKTNQVAEWDSTNGGVVWVARECGFGVPDNEDIYMIWDADGKHYITDAAGYDGGLRTGLLTVDWNPVTDNSETEGMQIFTGGNVYFRAYLNQKAINDYSIERNHYIHARINGIANGDYFFPGEPTPTPPGPGPVDGDPASVIIDVEAMPWTYTVDDMILQ